MTTAYGTPCSDRKEAVSRIADLGTRSKLCNVFEDGPLLVSDIPSDLKNGSKKAVLGIDEAGRGPVLGPMVYASTFWAANLDDAMSKKGFDDSKQLTHVTRSKIFDKIKDTDNLGFTIRVIHASEISRNMFNAKEPYNLNAMSHDAAISMIRAVLNAGVKLEHVYIDTVGTPQSYQAKLERIFMGHNILFTVEKKADSKYASCSAASICAKVIRDDLTTNWKWSEPHFEPALEESAATSADKDDDEAIEQKIVGFGSGYPSDPKCKAWLQKNILDPVFVFPDFVRFSWGPAKDAAQEHGALVEWEADEEENDEEIDAQQTTMSDFFSSTSKNNKRCNAVVNQGAGANRSRVKRLKVFEDLGIQETTTFVFGS